MAVGPARDGTRGSCAHLGRALFAAEGARGCPPFPILLTWPSRTAPGAFVASLPAARHRAKHNQISAAEPYTHTQPPVAHRLLRLETKALGAVQTPLLLGVQAEALRARTLLVLELDTQERQRTISANRLAAPHKISARLTVSLVSRLNRSARFCFFARSSSPAEHGPVHSSRSPPRPHNPQHKASKHEPALPRLNRLARAACST